MKTELLLLNQPDNYLENRANYNRQLNIERAKRNQYLENCGINMKGKDKDECDTLWKKWKWER